VSVHPQAVIDSGATLGRGVVVGPLAYIGPHVVIGDGCRIHHHATVEGHTTLGENCEVFPQAVLGAPPQDVKYEGESTTLEIGSNNVFREMVTCHPGTANGGGVTKIGNDNLLLVGAHVAHDCIIGSHCIFANYVQFAGHVHVEDYVNMGGHSAVHHFVTVGRHAFIGGMTRVPADVPPFMIVVAARGTRSEIRMVNGVGLERCGFSYEDVGALKAAFLKIFSRRARLSRTSIRDRVEVMLNTPDLNEHVKYLCDSLMRSFAHGRHGRYLEALRKDPVHRASWKLNDQDDKAGSGERLTVDVVGDGEVTKICAQRHDRGDILQLTAKAASGWSFSGWNGNLSGDTNPVDVVLDGPKRVTATFTKHA